MRTFRFYRFRFHLRAIDKICFPPGMSCNALRGSFGKWLRDTSPAPVYQRLFEPGRVLRPAPSGLADWPRPFLFRASHLDGVEVLPNEEYHFDLHTFDMQEEILTPLRAVFPRITSEGIGPRRGRATLERIEQLDLYDRVTLVGDEPGPACALQFEPAEQPVSRVKLCFQTPTELKVGGKVSDRPEFGILFGRLRDRVSTLGALYGDGPMEMDFRAIGERANAIRLSHCQLRWEQVERRSGRTGQVHPLGGFTGIAEYDGSLAEFLPWLQAARWVGVGRQTVWGKGDVRVLPVAVAAG